MHSQTSKLCLAADNCSQVNPARDEKLAPTLQAPQMSSYQYLLHRLISQLKIEIVLTLLPLHVACELCCVVAKVNDVLDQIGLLLLSTSFVV